MLTHYKILDKNWKKDFMDAVQYQVHDRIICLNPSVMVKLVSNMLLLIKIIPEKQVSLDCNQITQPFSQWSLLPANIMGNGGLGWCLA